MPIPTPQERPDLYDDYDGRPDGPKPGEQTYWDSVVPDHVKEMMAQKGGEKPGGQPVQQKPDQQAE